MNLDVFRPSGRPIKKAEYTSGTGTYTLYAAGNLIVATIQGAAGGPCDGSTVTAGGAGAGGAYLRIAFRFPDATLTYAVGAAGVRHASVGTDGGASRVGSIVLAGGKGASGANGSEGGVLGSVRDSASVQTPDGGTGLHGGAGGAGSASAAGEGGQPPGTPYPGANYFGVPKLSAGGANHGGTHGGGGGGGSSPLGRGGDGGAGNSAGAGGVGGNATGYGAGGGGGGRGSSAGGNGGVSTGGWVGIEEYML
jgi:hypothetical protein